MKKTTEKINTLQMNSDLWPRPDLREGVQGEVTAPVSPLPDEGEHEWDSSQSWLWCGVDIITERVFCYASQSERWADELRVWTAGVESRHADSHVSSVMIFTLFL